MKIGLKFFPVCSNGTVPHWVRFVEPKRAEHADNVYDEEIEGFSHWRSNEPFADVVKFVDIQRGRSAAYFIARSKTRPSATFCVFMTDLLHMIQSEAVRGNGVVGKFQIVKRGQNYGLRLVEFRGEAVQ